jgi:hypothetical protein
MPSKGGTFLGTLPKDHPFTDPLGQVMEMISKEKIQQDHGDISPEQYMKLHRDPSEEGMVFENRPDLLWIRRHKGGDSNEVPMSGNPFDPSEA